MMIYPGDYERSVHAAEHQLSVISVSWKQNVCRDNDDSRGCVASQEFAMSRRTAARKLYGRVYNLKGLMRNVKPRLPRGGRENWCARLAVLESAVAKELESSFAAATASLEKDSPGRAAPPTSSVEGTLPVAVPQGRQGDLTLKHQELEGAVKPGEKLPNFGLTSASRGKANDMSVKQRSERNVPSTFQGDDRIYEILKQFAKFTSTPLDGGFASGRDEMNEDTACGQCAELDVEDRARNGDRERQTKEREGSNASEVMQRKELIEQCKAKTNRLTRCGKSIDEEQEKLKEDLVELVEDLKSSALIYKEILSKDNKKLQESIDAQQRNISSTQRAQTRANTLFRRKTFGLLWEMLMLAAAALLFFFTASFIIFTKSVA